jgi:Flp pilus assembly protein TadG
MTVEFVFMAPLLIMLLLFIVLAGRVVEAHGEVDGAARDAARAASIAQSPTAAQAAAQQAVAADVNGWCQRTTVQGFTVGSPSVTVTLNCRLNLSFIGLGTMAINGYAIAPLDPYVARDY